MLAEAPNLVGGGVDSLEDGFVVSTFRDDVGGPCLVRRFDRDGNETSSFEQEAGYGCAGPIAGPNGELLLFDDTARVWVGNVDGIGEWREVERELGPVELASTRLAKLGDAGVVLEQGSWPDLVRLSWEGTIEAELRLPFPDGSSFEEAVTVAVAAAWNGQALAAAWTVVSGNGEYLNSETWFQRLDVDLQPIDPEPTLVVAFSWDDFEQYIRTEPLAVAWDGTSWSVPIVWFEGRGEFGEDPMLDVFVVDDLGALEGSFPLDRFAEGTYHALELRELFGLPDRVVLALQSELWTRAKDGELVTAWSGIDLVPLDLASHERMADDGLINDALRDAPMARSGNRLGVLRVESDSEDGQRRETLSFTVADCAAVFGLE